LISRGYGIEELIEVEFADSFVWRLLQSELPQISAVNIARFTLEPDAESEEVCPLVSSVSQP